MTENQITLDLTSKEAGVLVQLSRAGGAVTIGEFDEAVRLALGVNRITMSQPQLMASLLEKLTALSTVAENMMIDELGELVKELEETP